MTLHLEAPWASLRRSLKAGVALAAAPVLMGFVLGNGALFENDPVPPVLSTPLHFYVHEPEDQCDSPVAVPVIHDADALHCYLGESMPDALGWHTISFQEDGEPYEVRIRFADLIFETAAELASDDLAPGVSIVMGVRPVEASTDLLAVFGLECSPDLREDGVLSRAPDGTVCFVDSTGAASALAVAARDAEAVTRTELRFMVSPNSPAPMALTEQDRETGLDAISMENERLDTERGRLIAERDRITAEAGGETDWQAVIAVLDEALELEDYERAAAQFAPLAEAGNPAAQTMLGFLYRMGSGVEQDPVRAIELFTAAAEGGYEAAYVALCDDLGGTPYDPDLPLGVEGVPFGKLDVARAVAVCARAIEVAPDNLRIGEQYGRALLAAALESDTPDFGPVHDLIRPAAEAGRRTAQYQWGMIFYNGYGLERDHDEAFAWIERATRAGNPAAMSSLGYFYWSGEGTEVDQLKAVALWEEAAAAGDDVAHRNLGVAYQNGTVVAQDYARAAELYGQAIDAGNADAMIALGYLYLEGLGVTRDLAEAERLFRMGADKDSVFAQTALEALKSARKPSSALALYTEALEGIYAGTIDSHFLMPLETPHAHALSFGFFDALLTRCEPVGGRLEILAESRRFTNEMYNSFLVFYGSQVRGRRFGPDTSFLEVLIVLEADLINAANTMNVAQQAAAPHAEVLVEWALGRFGGCGSEGYNKLVTQLFSATMFGTIEPAANTAGPVLISQELMDNGMLMLCVYDDDLSTRAAYSQTYKTYHAVNVGLAASPIIHDPTFLRASCPATPDPTFVLESHTRELGPVSSEGIAGETLAEQRANYFIERLLPELPVGLSSDPELTERFRPILVAIESIEVPRSDVSGTSGSFVQQEFRAKLERYSAVQGDLDHEFWLLLSFYDQYRDRVIEELP